MFGGVGVLLESMQLRVFGHRRHKLLQVGSVRMGVLLFAGPPLLFSLPLPLPLCLNQQLLFLTFLLHMSLHVCNLAFNQIEFLTQLLVILGLLLDLLIVEG